MKKFMVQISFSNMKSFLPLTIKVEAESEAEASVKALALAKEKYPFGEDCQIYEPCETKTK